MPVRVDAVTPAVTAREDKVPTLVKLDEVMPDPRALPLRTDTPLIR